MMNKLTAIILPLLSLAQIGCALSNPNGPLVTLNTTVKNEQGAPIPDVTVEGGFRGVTTQGSIVGDQTDENGHAQVSGHTLFSIF
jgi:hypothetical protein